MPPRGGRGGPGGMRGRPPPGKVRIGGQEVEVDPELEALFDGRPKPSETFPDYEVAKQRPISEKEKTEIGRYCSIRDRIHKGPLYTTIEDTPAISRPGKKRARPEAAFDAFNGMETYSQRYVVKRRKIPRLDTRPYVLHFFPPELHGILDPSAKANGTAAPKKRKQLQTDFDPEEAEAEAADEGKMDEDDEEAAKKPLEEGEVPPDEDVDDDFSEDDDDGGDDYNAENYFDDGADEVEDMDGGGGDDYE